MAKESQELFVKAPWGNIALVTWGDKSLEPVLMVHGRQDSAATFALLVDQLPETFYYVGVDLPGNGKSDTYPKGLVITRYHLIAVVDIIMKHMRWSKFIFMGHSMGCEVGLFYNAVWPGHISKFIHLDAGPTFQRLQQPDHVKFFKHYYERYYRNYHRYNTSLGKEYTKRQALDAVMKSRKLTEYQAEVILSRSLVQIGKDKYRFSWDPRVKYIVPQNTTNDFYIYLFTKNVPPSLLISMSDGHGSVLRGKDGADELIKAMVSAGNCCQIVLNGGHDHHVIEPAEVGKYVVDFINKSYVRSKI